MELHNLIETKFKGAKKGKELTKQIIEFLDTKKGFTKENTIFGTSTCPDEICRNNTEFAKHYGENFIMGGLAGLPHTGLTGAIAFSHHTPDCDGTRNLLLLYAPHIAVGKEGIGKVKRRGMNHCTTACGSMFAALNKLMNSWENNEIHIPRIDYRDNQQREVTLALAKKIPKIMKSENKELEALEALYEEIDNQIMEIIQQTEFDFDGRITLIGGIQINLDCDETECKEGYFQLRRFGSFHNRKEDFQSYTEELNGN